MEGPLSRSRKGVVVIMSTKYVLTVYVPDREVFDAYWYGTGVVVSDEPVDDEALRFNFKGGRQIVVDYGTDKYRADYQAGRFGSGLYFAKVDEVEE